MKLIIPKPHLLFEHWKYNKEYGVYVSDLGNFRDKNKRPIPPKIYARNGYVAVRTECGDKLAHRIVMYTWRPIADREAFTVDHLDHNKRNNAVSNLQWVTQEENIMRSQDDLVSEVSAPEASNEVSPLWKSIIVKVIGIELPINETTGTIEEMAKNLRKYTTRFDNASHEQMCTGILKVIDQANGRYGGLRFVSVK